MFISNKELIRDNVYIFKKNIINIIISLLIYYLVMFTTILFPIYIFLFKYFNISNFLLYLSNNNEKIFELYLNIIINFLNYLILFTSLILINRKKILIDIKRLFKDKYFLFSLIYDFIVLFFLSTILLIIINFFIKVPESVNQQISVNFINLLPILSGFSMILFGPLCEEIIFRYCICGFIFYYLYNSISNKYSSKISVNISSIIAILISGLCFAFIHVQSGDYIAIFPYLITGIFLSYLFIKKEFNVVYTCILHSILNISAFISVLN